MLLYSLIYTSTATRSLTADDLEQLLDECYSNNLSRDVTGVLLYRNGQFIQALEGENATVLDLFTTIREDERHQRIRVLCEEPIQKRLFAGWAMALHNLDHIDLRERPGYADYMNLPFDSEALTGDPQRVQALLAMY
ncbi:MAG: BLUF domain-containing protein, partial [Chloroflexota bacterium]